MSVTGGGDLLRVYKVPENFPTFASIFDLTPIEEDFLLHLVWKVPPKKTVLACTRYRSSRSSVFFGGAL